MNLFKHRKIAGAAVIVCLGLGLSAAFYLVHDSSDLKVSGKTAVLRQSVELAEILSGKVTFTSGHSIYRMDTGSHKPALLVENGSYPRWSPDGEFVAFVRGNRIMRVRSDGSEEEVLATASEARAVDYHPGGNQVLFTDGDCVRSVELDTGKVGTILEGWEVRELDISADGLLLAATVRKMGYHVYVFDLRTGEARRLARGCSANMSPDGLLVSNNRRGHRVLEFLSAVSGDVSGSIHSLPDCRFDNHSWANAQDWIVYISEAEEKDVFAHRVSTDEAFRLTFRGNCDRPDFYVRP